MLYTSSQTTKSSCFFAIFMRRWLSSVDINRPVGFWKFGMTYIMPQYLSFAADSVYPDFCFSLTMSCSSWESTAKKVRTFKPKSRCKTSRAKKYVGSSTKTKPPCFTSVDAIRCNPVKNLWNYFLRKWINDHIAFIITMSGATCE